MRAPLLRSAQRARSTLILSLLAVVAAAGCTGSDQARPAPVATPPPPATAAATTTTEVPEAAGRALMAYAPALGDCFDERTRTDDKTGRPTGYVLAFDCGLPHEQEVFAVVDYTGPPAGPNVVGSVGSVDANPRTTVPTAFPGDEALRRFARIECPKRFPDYVGQAYELSRYGLDFVLPEAERWPAQHQVGCALVDAGGRRTSGSARGSGA